MMRLLKAEYTKYLIEIRIYYPDHIAGMFVTLLVFSMFLLVNQANSGDAYIGFVYWYLLSSVISEAAVSISAEKQRGILEQLIIKPIAFEWIILARTLVWLGLNFVKVVIVSFILVWIMRLNLMLNVYWIVIFVLTVIGVFGFTLFLVGLTLKYTKTASFDSILSYALLFLTGAVLPKEQMPSWAVQMGEFLPITNGIKLTRTLNKGLEVAGRDYASLAIQSFVFLLIGYFMFKWIYHSSKKSGIDRTY